MAEICREHPRFHNWLGSREETGLGLCCEETARLILTDPDPFALVPLPDTSESPEPEDPLLDPLTRVREQLFTLLQTRSLPLARRLELLSGLGWALQHRLGEPASLSARCAALLTDGLPPLRSLTPADGRALLDAVKELERLSEEWETLLCHAVPERFAAPEGLSADEERELERLAVYLVYRYFLPMGLDGDLCTPLCLPEAAARLVGGLWRCDPRREEPVRRQRIAQLFSKEIEYSLDNLDQFGQAALGFFMARRRS